MSENHEEILVNFQVSVDVENANLKSNKTIFFAIVRVQRTREKTQTEIEMEAENWFDLFFSRTISEVRRIGWRGYVRKTMTF